MPDSIYGIFLGFHSSTKGRWQQQALYFKRKGRVLHLKTKCSVPMLEERVQDMKTQGQGATLHALPPIKHLEILQHPPWGAGKLLHGWVRANRCPPALSDQHLCPSTCLDTAAWRGISDLPKQRLKAACDTQRKQLAAASSVNQAKRTGLNSYFSKAGCDLHWDWVVWMIFFSW